MKLDDGIDTFRTSDYFKNSRVVLFVVPGAFTLPVLPDICPALLNLPINSKPLGLIKLPVWR